jgi:hypothetical protein
MSQGMNLAIDPVAAGLSAASALTGPLVTLAVASARLASAPVRMVLDLAADRTLGPCASCGSPVSADDPFLRYRGDYYHADRCVEWDPPALRHANVPAV